MAERLPSPPRLIERAQYPRIAVLLALMVLTAATEGLGLVLLVPMLELLGSDAGLVGGMLHRLGLEPRLDALLILFAGLVTLRALVVHWRALAGLRLETAVVDSLRERAWRGLLHCEWRVLLGLKRSNSASLLISRVDQAGGFVNQLITASSAAVTLGGIAIAALFVSPALALVAMALGLAVLAAFLPLHRKASALGVALGHSYAAIHGKLQEGLGTLRLIKTLGTQDRAHADLALEFAGLRAGMVAYERVKGQAQAWLQGLAAVLLALLVWLAVERWQMTVAVILPMIALFARALPLIAALQQTLANCAHAWPAVSEALDLIAVTEKAAEPPAAVTTVPELQQEIRIEAATIHFAGTPRPALDAVSLTIPARGILAITGPSGSGKSTLADLIGGLLEPDSGRIVVDGVPLCGPLRQAWRRRVAYVQQDPMVISASLRDNLRWAAPQADDRELSQALHAAAAGFTLDLPLGLDTMLGDGGRQLSGGERQRLMLARALLRDPAVLILDEATSALDQENEKQIGSALRELAKDKAIIIIGHCGRLLDMAEKEVSLENGRLRQNG